MASYLETVEGKYFTDLTKDVNFQKDLVRFFTGPRYGLELEEVKELGPQGLAEKFVEHMRWQNTNEWIAYQDLNYVTTDGVDPQELESFGNLITAYDKAEGGGTGMLSGAADYIAAFSTSPSTLATVATGGWGIGSKLAAKAGGKAAQVALRSQIQDMVVKGITKKAIQDKLAGTVTKGAVKGAVTSFAVEGAVGAAHAGAQGKTKAVTTGTEYTSQDLLRDGLIAGTLGAGLGSISRTIDTKRQRALLDNIIQRDAANVAKKESASAAARSTITASNGETVSAAADRAVTIATTLKAKRGGVKLDPLDPKLVEEGNILKKGLLTSDASINITSNLDMNTLRSITAATIEISDKLQVKPNERISTAVSRALSSGDVDSKYFENLRDTYNLSKEQMSYIYLADLSQAGKTLAEASNITKKTTRKAATKTAKGEVKRVSSDLETLAEHGLNTLADKEVAEAMANIYNGKDTVLTKLYKAGKDTDAARIAFMTSQLGTTAANTATSTGNLLIDMSDQFWKNVAAVTVGTRIDDKVQRRWVGGTLSTIKGMTLNKTDAQLLKEVFLEEAPEQYSQLFYEATRAEVAVESYSRAATVSRWVNVLNSTVDSVFKEATLYSSVDRSLRELNDETLGKNLGEFLGKKLPLDSLPEGVMSKAVDDAKRFTFQRSYAGDKSVFGQTAQAVITAHHKLPFVVSAAGGMPFPRYIANHLEHVNDYTPIGIITGGLNKLDPILFGDANKTGADRFARQMTGASLIMLGAYTAAQGEGKIDYDKIKTETSLLDISRTAGPWLFNFYLGDLYYRYQNDLPAGDVLKEMKELSLGNSELGMNFDLVAQVSAAASEGEITQELAKSLGDIAATFTYPLTATRDFIAQVDPERISTPYNKEIFGGDPNEVSDYGEGNFLDELILRATRFLPETDFVQYTQSLNGKTAIPYYSPDSDVPVGTFNPLSKQFGFAASPKPNELQKEMSKLKIDLYEVYGSNTAPKNPAVDMVVRERLGKSMPKAFYEWKSKVTHGERFAGKTFDEITDNNDKAFLLRKFWKDQIQTEVDSTTEAFKTFLETNPKAAAGYLRKVYVIEEKKAVTASGEPAVYDLAVKAATQGEFETAEAYLGDSESVEEELLRRQDIMSWAMKWDEGFVPIPKNQYQ